MDRRPGDSSNARLWRASAWAAAAGVLLTPLMLRAPWTVADYVTAAALLGCVGVMVELAVRASGDLAYRAGAAVAVAAGALLTVVNGAVGFLGSEDNPANLIFLAVLGIAAAGSVLAGFRPGGMAGAMFATAAAQVLAGAGALAAGLGSPGLDGVGEVVLGTCLFSAMWLASAGLFRRAADRISATPE
ncbi:hypothetical protein [Phenylobacterium sp.]|uniref:hypothetical protein n=1 Tax=Phenylobacterium sp. TaxID=1871053 RepID=UPI002E343126|nr:hypothetical protein [Phenylobacterium sp.]HEX2560358.1 hypothetical protein [Phenylobacterium sp.]